MFPNPFADTPHLTLNLMQMTWVDWAAGEDGSGVTVYFQGGTQAEFTGARAQELRAAREYQAAAQAGGEGERPMQRLIPAPRF